jgi:hypothetical protein
MITINKSNATFIVHSLRTSPGGAFQWEHSAPNTLNQQNAINQQNCTLPHNYSLSRCCSRIHGCITMRSGWQMNAACYMLIAHTRPWVSSVCARASGYFFLLGAHEIHCADDLYLRRGAWQLSLSCRHFFAAHFYRALGVVCDDCAQKLSRLSIIFLLSHVCSN